MDFLLNNSDSTIIYMTTMSGYIKRNIES